MGPWTAVWRDGGRSRNRDARSREYASERLQDGQLRAARYHPVPPLGDWPAHFLVSGSAATPILNRCAPRLQAPIAAEPFHKWVFPDGTLCTDFYRDGDRYLIRFPALADFTVVASGTEVAVYPVPGVSDQTVEHLYLNQVGPLALSRQWQLVLH